MNHMIQPNVNSVSWVRPEQPCKVVGLAVIHYGAGILMDTLSKHFAS